MSGSQLRGGPFSNNQMRVAHPRTGELKHFLVGPLGIEVTGISTTPDFRTLLVNIQHPGEGSTADNLLSAWPDGLSKRPRGWSTFAVASQAHHRPRHFMRRVGNGSPPRYKNRPVITDKLLSRLRYQYCVRG